MINCHRSIGSESHNVYVLTLRAGQVPCAAVTLAFLTVVSPQMFHARYSEQRKDVSTHFPEGSPWPKREKVSCDELLCLSFFLFPVPACYACAELRVRMGAGYLFIFFVVFAFQAIFC